MPSPPRVLVTGASGYIGTRLVHAARERGWEVVAAVCNPERTTARQQITAHRFDLRSPGDLGAALEGVGAVIHLAAILDPQGGHRHDVEDANVSGTATLLQAARQRRVQRFIFVSSQSAEAGSPTAYGRSKWQIEQMLSGPGEIAVRPGLVYGGAERGVYGQLCRLVKRLRVLPVARPATPVYPVHVDDLCACLLDLASAPGPLPRLLHAGPAVPLGFGAWLRLLARGRFGSPVRILPLPAVLIVAGARLAALAGPHRLALERIRGLLSLPPVPADLIAASSEICRRQRDPEEALAAEGRRRRLAAEGKTLMTYLLGRRASPGVVGRYVRAALAEPDARPLRLPPGSRVLPFLVCLVDPAPGEAGARYRRRLQLATRIAEMTPAAAPRFHNYSRRTRLLAWLSLPGLLLLEAAILPLRASLGRLLLSKDRTGR